MLPNRKRFHHTPPSWIPDASLFFITICCSQRGHNTLAKPEIAEPLFESVAYREQLQQWNVSLILLMPDHLHAFIALSPNKPMEQTIAAWKRFTAKTLPINWQDGFFDHLLRSQTETDEKWSYILNNPVRANLCQSPESWPYKSPR
ncbi:MAG: transposase [Opitutaceae bacterium]|nr:transposase [Opitutaceae bacterium]